MIAENDGKSRPPGWDVRETRTLISRLYGTDQLDRARRAIDSILYLQEYARFHYFSANALLGDLVDSRSEGGTVLFAGAVRDDEYGNVLQTFFVKVGAHLTACIQCLHAMSDSVALAVHFALAMDSQPGALSLRQVNLESVRRALQPIPDAQTVRNLFDLFCDAPGYTHLSDFANHEKHRGLLRPSLSEDHMGLRDERVLLRYPDFGFKDRVNCEIAARDLIEPEFNRRAGLVVDIGRALNDVLGRRLST